MRRPVRHPGEQEQNRGADCHEMGDRQADGALGWMGASRERPRKSQQVCGPFRKGQRW